MSDDQDEPELTAAERAALATLPVTVPPDGFADRVMARRTAVPMTAAVRPAGARFGLRFVAAAAGIAVAGAAVVVLALGHGAPQGASSTGAVTTTERRSLALGDRAVAVAEPGAVLAWSIDGRGRARVDQGNGDVFYRVGHGGPFVVATPLGEVRVTGTCFRIEVIMKASKQALIGGAVGAALAAAVVVTVYEGGVVVAGSGGSTRKVAPGERAMLAASDGSLAVAAAGKPLEIEPPAATASRDQLLARDQLQRQQIATLTSRVGELERQVKSGSGGKSEDRNFEDGRPWYDPTEDTLKEWAKHCQVRFDSPSIMGSQAYSLAADNDFGLTGADLDAVNTTMGELQRSWTERVRVIYLEIVGEGGDDSLSAQAMIQEIEDKSPPGESNVIIQRIAQERAGMVPAPTDLSKAPATERLFRAFGALGDETERLLAAKIGPERAHEMRVKNGGWDSKWQMGGCPGDKH